MYWISLSCCRGEGETLGRFAREYAGRARLLNCKKSVGGDSSDCRMVIPGVCGSVKVCPSSFICHRLLRISIHKVIGKPTPSAVNR